MSVKWTENQLVRIDMKPELQLLVTGLSPKTPLCLGSQKTPFCLGKQTFPGPFDLRYKLTAQHHMCKIITYNQNHLRTQQRVIFSDIN